MKPFFLAAAALACAARAGHCAPADARTYYFEVESTGKASVDQQLSRQAVSVIRKRLTALGFKNAKVVPYGSGEIAATIPGSRQRTAEVMRLLSDPAWRTRPASRTGIRTRSCRVRGRTKSWPSSDRRG